MLKAMDRRLHNEYALEASLHGIRVPLRYNKESAVKNEPEFKMDPKEEERLLLEAQSRVKGRYVR